MRVALLCWETRELLCSLLEGWCLDGFRPDKGDVVGSAVALAGVLTIMLWPREGTCTCMMVDEHNTTSITSNSGLEATAGGTSGGGGSQQGSSRP